MQKLKKAILLIVRAAARRWSLNHLYYWSEQQLSAVLNVHVLPEWYYHCLYHSCIWVVRYKHLRRTANWAIHTIPYDMRFKIA